MIEKLAERAIKSYQEKALYITRELAAKCKICTEKRLFIDAETGEAKFLDCADFCVFYKQIQKELHDLYEDSIKDLPLDIIKEIEL